MRKPFTIALAILGLVGASACKRNADLATTKDDGSAAPSALDAMIDNQAMQPIEDKYVGANVDCFTDEDEDECSPDTGDGTGTNGTVGASLALDDDDGPVSEEDYIDEFMDVMQAEDGILNNGTSLDDDGTPSSSNGSFRGVVTAAYSATNAIPWLTQQLLSMGVSQDWIDGVLAGTVTTVDPAVAAAAAASAANAANPANPAITAASTTPDPAAASVAAGTSGTNGGAALRLTDFSSTGASSVAGPNRTTSTGTDTTKADPVRVQALQQKIVQLETLLRAYQQKNPLFDAVRNTPDAWGCVVNGATTRNNVCQCRGWGMDVTNHTFPIPTATTLPRFLVSAQPRRCPVLEQRYCNGWEAKSGGCGIYGKGVGYNIPALSLGNGAQAYQSRIAGDTDCFQTYQKIIRDNAGVIFSPPASCDRYFAVKRGDHVELWDFNATNSAFTQVDNATYNNTKIGASAADGLVPTGSIYATPTPTPGVLWGSSGFGGAATQTATTIAAFGQLCQSLANGTARAVWQASTPSAPVTGGGICICGNSRTSAVAYLGATSANFRSQYPQACQNALAGH